MTMSISQILVDAVERIKTLCSNIKFGGAGFLKYVSHNEGIERSDEDILKFYTKIRTAGFSNQDAVDELIDSLQIVREYSINTDDRLDDRRYIKNEIKALIEKQAVKDLLIPSNKSHVAALLERPIGGATLRK